jgi:CRISPR-associated protein Csd1
MILQALKGYYERELNNEARCRDQERDHIPPFGFEVAKIHFALILNREGNLVQIQDLRLSGEKGKPRPTKKTVPSLMKKRTSGVSPHFAWDSAQYVLGVAEVEKSARTLLCQSSFVDLMKEVGGELQAPIAHAVISFLDAWDPDQIQRYVETPEELFSSNFVFRLEDQTSFLHDEPEVREAWVEYLRSTMFSTPGFCLVKGEEEDIAKLHQAIKGVKGAQTSGATVIGFNKDAFISFNKEQNYNAPVGLEAAFEYTTALNDLLSDDSHHLQIGDATTVFWTARPTTFEAMFKDIIDGKAEAEENTDKLVRDFLEPLSRGLQPRELLTREPFYVLGLAPNQARIAVRYWYASTVEEMSRRIGEHFADLRIERQYDSNPEYPGMWHLLVRTAPLKGSGKRDSNRIPPVLAGEVMRYNNGRFRNLRDIPPVLAGEVMRSILTGAAYPRTLLHSIINRIRAEQEIDYLQAALIKACLVRQSRKLGQTLEVSMSLDTDNRNTPYLLGRLFAILEKTQRDALGRNLNRTIRDGYIASASAAPRAVFPRLLRLAQHHISKAEYGDFDNKRITEVLDEIDEFPTQLKLEDQGQFFIGYYHQRNSFFKKNPKADQVEETVDE